MTPETALKIAEVALMTAEMANEVVKTAKTVKEASETAKLPEQAGTPKETTRLPEQAGTPKETTRLPEQAGTPKETKEAGTIPETADVRDADLKKVSDVLSSPEGIKGLIERHPEKVELWLNEIKAIEKAQDVLNDPDATNSEKFSANKSLRANLSILKGQLLETAVKDALSDAGLTVEAKQRVVDGQDGGTRPDVIAKNDTDRPIQAFGITVKPGETLSIECKCGNFTYLKDELKNHIPNQLSGQIGHKALLATADIRQVDPTLVRDTCRQYGAALIVLDTKVSTIENAIKEVSSS